jgi:gliding motility-associated lipoprotein GldH
VVKIFAVDSMSFTFVKTFSLKKPLFNLHSLFNVPLLVATLTLCMASCMQLDSFEQSVQIKKHEWRASDKAEVTFNITDTVSAYNVFVVLRHTDAYTYKNIWLRIATRQPGDSSYRDERFELTLQQPDGTWIGTGLNDIWEIRHPLFTNVRFTKLGTYNFQLQQAMRDEPLRHIMNAGVRIEKVKQ